MWIIFKRSFAAQNHKVSRHRDTFGDGHNRLVHCFYSSTNSFAATKKPFLECLIYFDRCKFSAKANKLQFLANPQLLFFFENFYAASMKLRLLIEITE